jgi:two-component system chemotaxis response regulator CheY
VGVLKEVSTERRGEAMSTRRRRVLVVDDSETLRRLVTLSLRFLEGCEVVEASNAYEALRLLKEQPFDLAIVDIYMPEISGLQLLGIIKSDPNLRSIPVIILTTARGEEDRRRGMELGADRYLTKPFKPRVLVEVVKELLESKGRGEEEKEGSDG